MDSYIKEVVDYAVNTLTAAIKTMIKEEAEAHSTPSHILKGEVELIVCFDDYVHQYTSISKKGILALRDNDDNPLNPDLSCKYRWDHCDVEFHDATIQNVIDSLD